MNTDGYRVALQEFNTRATDEYINESPTLRQVVTGATDPRLPYARWTTLLTLKPDGTFTDVTSLPPARPIDTAIVQIALPDCGDPEFNIAQPFFAPPVPIYEDEPVETAITRIADALHNSLGVALTEVARLEKNPAVFVINMQGTWARLSSEGLKMPSQALVELTHATLNDTSYLVIGTKACDILLNFNEPRGAFVVSARLADKSDLPVIRSASADRNGIYAVTKRLDPSFNVHRSDRVGMAIDHLVNKLPQPRLNRIPTLSGPAANPNSFLSKWCGHAERTKCGCDVLVLATIEGHYAYPHIVRETLGEQIIRWCSKYVNRKIEPDHRRIERSYYPCAASTSSNRRHRSDRPMMNCTSTSDIAARRR